MILFIGDCSHVDNIYQLQVLPFLFQLQLDPLSPAPLQAHVDGVLQIIENNSVSSLVNITFASPGYVVAILAMSFMARREGMLLERQRSGPLLKIL